MLFFYSKSKDGVWLNLKKGDLLKNLIKAPMPFTKWARSHELYGEFIESAPIEISEDLIVFVGENRNLWAYNIKKNELKDSGITNCTPRAYRTSQKEIVCESLWIAHTFCYHFRMNTFQYYLFRFMENHSWQ